MTGRYPAVGPGFGPGSVLAGYRLEVKVGEGGMAVVYRARDERLHRLVALKILAPEFTADAAFRLRFVRESEAAAAVDHPHIIPIYLAGDADGVLFISMRFVAGGDLRRVMEREGLLSAARVAEIISPVASALDAAHAAGLVHRDVKPGNILVDTGPGRPDHMLLSDFGISKSVTTERTLTGTGQFIGTAGYSAPEQIEERPVDGRADQYALACVTWELLTGATVFQRETIYGVLMAHAHEQPPPLTSRRPDLPFAADDVMARALAKSPGERYPSCADFADALREAFRLPPYHAGRADQPPARPSQPPGAERPSTQAVEVPSPPRQPRTVTVGDSAIIAQLPETRAGTALVPGPEGPRAPAQHPPTLPVAALSATAPAEPAEVAEELRVPEVAQDAEAYAAPESDAVAEPVAGGLEVAEDAEAEAAPESEAVAEAGVAEALRAPGEAEDTEAEAVPEAEEAAAVEVAAGLEVAEDAEAEAAPESEAVAEAGVAEALRAPRVAEDAEAEAVPEAEEAAAVEVAAELEIADAKTAPGTGVPVGANVGAPGTEVAKHAEATAEPEAVAGTEADDELEAVAGTEADGELEATAEPVAADEAEADDRPDAAADLEADAEAEAAAETAGPDGTVGSLDAPPRTQAGLPGEDAPVGADAAEAPETPGLEVPGMLDEDVPADADTPTAAGPLSTSTTHAAPTANPVPAWPTADAPTDAADVPEVELGRETESNAADGDESAAAPGPMAEPAPDLPDPALSVAEIADLKPVTAGQPPTRSARDWRRRLPVVAASVAAVGAAVAILLTLNSPASTPRPQHSASHSAAATTPVTPPHPTRIPLPKSMSGLAVAGLAYSPSGSELAIASAGGICLMDVATRHCVSIPASVDSVAFNADGTILASGDVLSGHIQLWRAATGGQMLRTLKDTESDGVLSVAFSPVEKTTLAVGDQNGNAFLWDVAAKKPVPLTLPDPAGSGVNMVAFSPDASMLALGDTTGNIYVYQIATGKLIAHLHDPGSKHNIWSIAFSPDGKMLAAADGNGRTYLWNVVGKKLITSLSDTGGKGVHAVAFSPNGRVLATGDLNGSTYLWRVSDGKLITSLSSTRDGGVTAVAFSHNGGTLVTGNQDGSVDTWPVSPLISTN